MESWAAAGWSHPAQPSQRSWQWRPRSASHTDLCDPVQRHSWVWLSRAGSCTRYNHPQCWESCCCHLAGYSGHIEISQHQQWSTFYVWNATFNLWNADCLKNVTEPSQIFKDQYFNNSYQLLQDVGNYSSMTQWLQQMSGFGWTHTRRHNALKVIILVGFL